MPEPTPTTSAPTVSARNACTLSQTISTTMMAMPSAATASTWVSCASRTGVVMRCFSSSGRQAQGGHDVGRDPLRRRADLDADGWFVGGGLLERGELAVQQRG